MDNVKSPQKWSMKTEVYTSVYMVFFHLLSLYCLYSVELVHWMSSFFVSKGLLAGESLWRDTVGFNYVKAMHCTCRGETATSVSIAVGILHDFCFKLIALSKM